MCSENCKGATSVSIVKPVMLDCVLLRAGSYHTKINLKWYSVIWGKEEIGYTCLCLCADIQGQKCCCW
jgi:hypothetical protein